VYVNTARVDETLVSLITRPAEADGALDAFVEILSGNPGPRPETLAPLLRLDLPLAVFWGTDDQVTPLGGPVGQYFQRLPGTRPGSTEFTLIPGTGHCPFDDRPDLCSPALLSWLERTWSAAPAGATPAAAPVGATP
jgi:pimeloyl-ACP methyl ester carboxylesterase